LTSCAKLTSITRSEISRSKVPEKVFHVPYLSRIERITSENSRMAKHANHFHHAGFQKKHS
jgi:hypothetical protein